MLALFFQKDKYIRINPNRSNRLKRLNQSPGFPMNYFPKCPGCKHIIYQKDLGSERICPDVVEPFRISLNVSL